MAERMGQTEFRLWQDKLRYAKRLWVEKGLIGTHRPSKMRMLIEFYRSQQWDHYHGEWAGLDSAELVTANKIFPIANSVLGDVAAHRPEIEILPDSENALEAATPVEHLINRDLKELRWKRQANDVLADHLFAPVGVLRHGFTPSEEWESKDGRRLERYGRAKPDRPWVRRWPIWNTLLDPHAERFHVDGGMRWCAFRSLMDIEDIRQNPGMIDRKDLGQFKGNISREWVDMLPHHLRETQDEDPEKGDFVEVWTVYDLPERKWFQVTLDGLDKPLRQPNDWPIPWETLPVTLLGVNEQRDTPFYVPLMEVVIPQQEELNKVRTMLSILMRQIRRVIAVNAQGLEDGEFEKMTDGELVEFFKKKGQEDVLEQATIGGAPLQEMLLYAAQLEEDIREAVGQSKMGRGQRINVETAHEVERVQQGQDVNTARIAAAFEDFNEEALRLYMQARRETMQITGAEAVRLSQRDARGVQQWMQVSPDMMAGPFEIHVRVGSTRAKDRDREAQKAAIDLQIAGSVGANIADIDFFWKRYLVRRGIDPMKGSRRFSQQAAAIRSADQFRRDAQPGEEAQNAPEPASFAASLQAGNSGGGVAQ